MPSNKRKNLAILYLMKLNTITNMNRVFKSYFLKSYFSSPYIKNIHILKMSYVDGCLHHHLSNSEILHDFKPVATHGRISLDKKSVS
jgi:hypothetical protein